MLISIVQQKVRQQALRRSAALLQAMMLCTLSLCLVAFESNTMMGLRKVLLLYI